MLQRINEERFRKRKYRRNIICLVLEDSQGDSKKKKKNEVSDDEATLVNTHSNQQNEQTNQQQEEEAIGSTITTNHQSKMANKNIKTKCNKKQEINGCRPGSKNYNKFIAIQKRADKIIKSKAKEKNITNHLDDDTIDDDTIKTITICEEKTITSNIDDDTLLDGLSHITGFETDLMTQEKPDEIMQSKLFLFIMHIYFICCLIYYYCNVFQN